MIKSRYLFLLILASINIGIAKEKLTIHWTDTPIVIDGLLNEWEGKLIIQKNTGVAIQNDESFLYIAFSTMDQDLFRSMMRFGFVTWIDEGRKGKKIGVKFPIGFAKPGERPTRNLDQNKRSPRESSMEFLDAQTEFEIIKDAKHILARLPIENNFENIHIAVQNDNGKFNYELAIPLDNTDEYNFSVDTKNIKKIKVGFEVPTSVMGLQQGQGKGSGSGYSDGSRGSGGGGGGRSGGQGGMSSQRTPSFNNFSIWYKSPLANQNE